MPLDFKEALECELIPEDAMRFDNPDFDEAIVGVAETGQLIYDYELMVEQYMRDEDCVMETALDWIHYNTIRSMPYAGVMKPIILMTRINNE